MAISSRKLLDAATAIGAGAARALRRVDRTFQAIGSTSSGAGAATIVIEVSNDATNWTAIGTITLTLSTVASNDGFASAAAWSFARPNLTAISGTGAAVTVWVGV